MDLSIKNWPKIGDFGRRIELEMADGEKKIGSLCRVKLFTRPEGGTAPIFVIDGPDGIKHHVADPVSWNFT